jgi:putative chitobiose transport system substrate-binding protein
VIYYFVIYFLARSAGMTGWQMVNSALQRSDRWRRWGLLALVGLALSWLVACGGAGSTAKAQEVEFWTMQLQPQFTEYFNQRIQEFEQSHAGWKVRWVDVPWSEMERKILAAVSAKTAPDVVNLNPNFASQLAQKGAWLPLNDQISDAEKQQFLPNIWQANTLNNQTFGIPWYLTSRVAIYNTGILKQAGVAQPPKTYAELAQAAQQIKDKTGKYAFFATLVPTDSGEVMESFVQMGVKLVDDQGKAAFNSPEGKAAFQYWVDLYKKGLLPKDVLTEGHRQAIDLYQQGNTAILASSPEFLNTIAKNAPAVAQVSASAAQISGSTGKKNVAVMNLVIPKDSNVPDMAKQFALFIANDTNQLSFAKAANVLPSNTKALADPYFTTPGVTPVDKARSISAQQLKDAQVLIPAMKNVKELQKALYENMQAAMLDQKTVDQAIADAAAQWNQL